jgi:hypothetical protein
MAERSRLAVRAMRAQQVWKGFRVRAEIRRYDIERIAFGALP